MTIRAVIFGLLGAMLIAGLGYINDQCLQMASLLAGHLVPVAVFMIMLLMGGAIALLRFRARRGRVTPGELAVAMTLMMVGCSIPVSGLLETFTPSLVMPLHFNRQFAGWRKHRVLSYAPPSMLPGDGRYDQHPEVLDDFLTGKGDRDRYISVADVPWDQWRKPLITWVPLIVLSAIGMTCLGLIVHRQWSRRERLRYPIAEVATTLLSRRMEGQKESLFRNRLFWTGFAAIFAIHLINGIHRWYPNFINIPLQLNFDQVYQKWPILTKTSWGGNLARPFIVWTAVAFSFFLSSDIALSLGISQFIQVPLEAALLRAGVDISSGYMSGGPTAWQRFGSFFAFALIILYVGRRYYWDLLKRALAFRPSASVTSYEAWSCRALLAAMVAMVLIIWRLGLNLPMSVLVVGMAMMMFLTVARISAETGLFFIQPRWQPLGILLGLFGAYALGPQAIVIVGLICIALTFDPSQSLMPYFVNALKACDRLGVKVGRMGWSATGTYVVCLGLGLVVTLWANYDFGLTRHRFFTDRVPQMTFNAADRAVAKLESSGAGKLDESESMTALQRLANMKPDRRFIWAAGLGFALVLLFSAARLRFPWWPLHPVFFLVWATWPMVRLHHSFLLGWFIRQIVMKLGGNAKYQATKPLMIGVIAGDLLGAGFWMVYGGAYYCIYRLTPDSYWVFPH